jgi:DNA-binding response OmpR family regulator
LIETSANDQMDKRAGPLIVADNDPEIRRTVSSYFKKRGLSTLTARDARALRRLLLHRMPRLIVLDRQFGNANGYELLKSIRSSSDIPIIVMAERHVEESDQITGLDCGADDFVIKPVGLGELWARVRAILRRLEVMRRPPVREYKFPG